MKTRALFPVSDPAPPRFTYILEVQDSTYCSCYNLKTHIHQARWLQLPHPSHEMIWAKLGVVEHTGNPSTHNAKVGAATYVLNTHKAEAAGST